MPEFNNKQIVLDDYDKAKLVFWKVLYQHGGITLYSRQQFAQKKPQWINIEHVYPMSWVVNEIGCYDRGTCRRYSDEFNLIESDLHNMYPTRKALNRLRGSLSYGNVQTPSKYYQEYNFEIDFKHRVVEPDVMSQGNIARAMLYIADAYGMKIFSRQMRVLKQWHRLDPPSLWEKKRNDLIETIQGNRNHFIDYPRDVDLL
jgi:deoxyribonuclease-1